MFTVNRPWLLHPSITSRCPFLSRSLWGSLLIAMSFVGCVTEIYAQEPLEGLIAHAVSDPEGKIVHTFPTYPDAESRRRLPIGVFDSGLGGLTVLEAIYGLDAFHNETLQPGSDGRPDFEKERFIYLGDQANMPYGNYSSTGKADFLRELVLKDAIFLLGTRQRTMAGNTADQTKLPVKAIVIACNTATAVGLDDIRDAMKRWKIDIPVIGVVEAGAEAFRERSSRESADSTVAVLATVGTCNTQAYPKTLARVLGLAGRKVPNVVQQGSLGIAGAVEEDPAFVWHGNPEARPQPYKGPESKEVEHIANEQLRGSGYVDQGLLRTAQGDAQLNSTENYVRYDVAKLVESLHRSQDQRPIQTVVLGCTHFPLVQREIEKAFATIRNTTDADGNKPYQHLIAEKILVINPAEDAAKALFRELAKSKLRLHESETSRAMEDVFYMSVPNAACEGIRLTQDGRDLEYAYKYGRSTGHHLREDTMPVSLFREALPAASRSLVEQHLPHVWKRIPSTQVKSDVALEGYDWTFPAMGTTVTLQAYTKDVQHLQKVFEETRLLVEKQVSILTDYEEESETNQITSSAKIGQWQDCSTTLWSVLEASDRWYQLSEGKLDPAIGNLTRLWRKARRLKKHPSQDEIEMALGKCGWKWMELDRSRIASASSAKD